MKKTFMSTKIVLKTSIWKDFPGGPVAKTSCSQCKRPRFDPWSENQTPRVAMKTEDPVCHK